ncbi:MAG: hypothetical protein JXA99_07095, partial [Candidatus Lokiarchaeota archaeon]|nr:hypothetical protein [Candidatus Lokiarchaeota archaeon]
YWYTTSSYYWDGWCNANNEYQQIITEWTNDAIPMKTRLILNLVSTGISYPAVLGGFHPFMLIAPLILIGTIGILLIYGFIKLVSWTISKFKPYNNYPN